MKAMRVVVMVLLASLMMGCNLKVNKSITLDDGERVRHSLTTVNGNIYIGEDCRVGGGCRSVNGVIEVGEASEVEDLQAVNGGIDLDWNVVVHGDVESVNGAVRAESGVEVDGSVETVNGDITLQNTRVDDDLTTYNGDISLLDESVVRGDVIIKKNKGKSRRRRTLRIEIDGGSVVEGDVINKDRDLDVVVTLSDGGRVEGRVRHVEVVKR